MIVEPTGRRIPYWLTKMGAAEAEQVAVAVQEGRLSDGPISRDFENNIAHALDVPFATAVPSGSAGLLLALLAVGVQPGDEVIVPAATWIATANAAHILGAKVVLADTLQDRPLIDPAAVLNLITSKTKAVIAVHLGGRAAPVADLMKIAEQKGIYVIEDACQALFSKNEDGFLGTLGHIGCFSLSVSKLINTGQGGMVVTGDEEIHNHMSRIKLNGVTSDGVTEVYHGPGFNFKYSDLKAVIGLVQLGSVADKIQRVTDVYRTYRDRLQFCKTVSVCPINLEAGELPLWTEVEAKDVPKVQKFLLDNQVETRRFHTSLNHAPHLEQVGRKFSNSEQHANSILILPSGPSQPLSNVERTCDLINAI